jgi:hypothetical protein
MIRLSWKKAVTCFTLNQPLNPNRNDPETHRYNKLWSICTDWVESITYNQCCHQVNVMIILDNHTQKSLDYMKRNKGFFLEVDGMMITVRNTVMQ